MPYVLLLIWKHSEECSVLGIFNSTESAKEYIVDREMSPAGSSRIYDDFEELERDYSNSNVSIHIKETEFISSAISV